MTRLFRHSALLLLTTFVVGGFLAPVLHEVKHVEEWRQSRTEHTGTDHQHHTAADAHGTEVLPPCPDLHSMDLVCVLCQGVSVAANERTEALAGNQRSALVWQVVAAPAVRVSHGLYLVRGPPKQVA